MHSGSLPDFSKEQWELLAVLQALEGPVTIDLLGDIAPLRPGPFFNLLNQAKALNWVTQKGEDRFTIGTDLPAPVQNKLAEINTATHLSALWDKLQELNAGNLVPHQAKTALLNQIGRYEAASKIHIDLAEQALAEKDPEKAWDHFNQVADLLCNHLDEKKCQVMYTATVLKLSNLSFPISKNLRELFKHLALAQKACTLSGDRRSHALLHLHMGRLHLWLDEYNKLYTHLSRGIKEIEALGDEDIYNQAAVFIGILYCAQGQHKKAFPFMERAEKLYESREQDFISDSSAPVILGYGLAFLGDFHRAIGRLDFSLRTAVQRSNHSLALVLKAALGMMLVHIKQHRQAANLLESAMSEAVEAKNDIALRVARFGMALKSMNEGDSKGAYHFLSKAFTASETFLLSPGFLSPWILEMLYKFNQVGFKPIPGVEYQKTLQR
ncbi:MAG: tetratricopeptide repeat protein, partial [Deltaproteobacteria bacterium]|nr:tetratricopeptide repeat protein [Deltaproteobacteria bacterium]